MTNQQEINVNFGANLKRLRLRKKLNQAELAEKIGVSINTISEMERGVKFTGSKILAKLSNSLDIDVYELFMGRNISPNNFEQLLKTIEMTISINIEKAFSNYLKNKNPNN